MQKTSTKNFLPKIFILSQRIVCININLPKISITFISSNLQGLPYMLRKKYLKLVCINSWFYPKQKKLPQNSINSVLWTRAAGAFLPLKPFWGRSSEPLAKPLQSFHTFHQHYRKRTLFQTKIKIPLRISLKSKSSFAYFTAQLRIILQLLSYF